MYQRVFAWHLNLSVYRNARSFSVFLAVRRPVLKSLKQTLEAALGSPGGPGKTARQAVLARRPPLVFSCLLKPTASRCDCCCSLKGSPERGLLKQGPAGDSGS